ncbi:MAG: hypothetical protein AAF604_20450 [Acidobacteriota bacterium]
MRGNTRIGLLVLSFVLAAVWPGTAGAQTNEADFMQQAIATFNGTWTLAERLNPDGSPHRQPLQGTTTISLQPFFSELLGATALGTISAHESGVLDPKCSNCGPAEARGRPFKIESNGTWMLTIEKQGDTFFIVGVEAVTRIKGNYAPYLEGLNARVKSSYQFSKKGVKRVATDPDAKLLNKVNFGDLIELPTTDAGDPVPSHETADSC